MNLLVFMNTGNKVVALGGEKRWPDPVQKNVKAFLRVLTMQNIVEAIF